MWAWSLGPEVAPLGREGRCAGGCLVFAGEGGVATDKPIRSNRLSQC